LRDDGLEEVERDMKLVFLVASMMVLNATPAAAQVARVCGQGVTLRVSAAQVRQATC